MAKKNASAAKAAKTSKAPKAPKPPKAAKTAGAKPPKAPKPQKNLEAANGVTKPAEGTKTRRVWDIADKLSKNGPAARHDVMEACGKEGIPNATVATQYQRWRVFYGVTERSPRKKSEAAE